jgi:hypothetical protein
MGELRARGLGEQQHGQMVVRARARGAHGDGAGIGLGIGGQARQRGDGIAVVDGEAARPVGHDHLDVA